MQQIGFNAFDSQGKLKSLSQIMGEYNKALEGKTDQQKQDYTATIFGQEAMSGMMVLMQGGSGALDDLTNSYKNADGAAADMAKTMQDNSKSSVEQMMGSLETTAIKLEEDFAPVIIQICNEIQDLANRFSELSPEQQEFYAKLVLGLAVLGPTAKLIGGITSGVGGLVKVVGALAPVLGGAAGAEAAAAGGLAGFSGALVAMAPVALPVIAAVAALGVGVAAVATANDMLGDKLTRTTDDMTGWQKAINGMTGYTFKSKKELQDLGIEYKDFGDNISENFKKRVEESTRTLQEFELFLGKINLDGIIDDSESNEFTNQIKKMVDDSINAIKSKQSESQQALSKMFTLDDNKIDETEKKVIDSISETYDVQIKEEEDLKKEILDIKQKAVDEKRKLNDQEVKDIKDKNEQIKQIELEQVGGTDEEQEYGKNQFKARVERISADDASSLLKEKKDELDKQNDDIKASFDTNISLMKRKLSEAKAEDKAAIQEEIDKYTDLRNKKLNLKQDEYNEYIKILQEKNPEALALIDVFNGEVLKKEDKLSQDTLKDMKERYSGLSEITQSGTYMLFNKSKKAMEEVTVTVDAGTQIITGAYSESSNLIGGYTQKMAEDTALLGQAHSQLAIDCQKAMDNLEQAHIDAKGNIINASGQTVGALKDIQNENGQLVGGILEINGTPIKIETNADGTIKNLEDVKKSIEDIPKEREIAFRFFTTGEAAVRAGYNAMLAGGGSYMSYEDYKNSIGNHYTGANIGGFEGLTKGNEHGWEISTGESIYLMGGGSGIKDHMTSVNEMEADVNNAVDSKVGKVVNTLVSNLARQNGLLNQVAKNTSETATSNKENVKVNQKLATDLISNLNSNNRGSFESLNNEINSAKQATDHADSLTIDQNKWYSSSKAKLDDVQSKIDDISNQISSANDDVIGVEDKNVKKLSEIEKKQLEAQKHVLDVQKDSLEKEVNYYKDAAEKEIETCKKNAEELTKIAEAKKEKLTKLVEATSEAIKNELTKQKEAYDKAGEAELKTLEDNYNKKTKAIEDSLKDQTDAIDKQLKALEEKSTENSRDKEREEANKNIYAIQTKMDNTASNSDKRSLEIELEKAKKELSEKEEGWSIEDQKAELETEKTRLSEESEVKKKALEDDYNTQKEAKEQEIKDTDAYYDKLLEQDSINAQTRYVMLNASNQQLVELLQSYNPLWQDAGQELADSLLTGLNSQKQSIQDAVNEIAGFRTGSTQSSNVAYYDEKGNLLKGYASGTSYNRNAGYYLTNEKGWETVSNGDVAYVSEGAAIRNNMQSVADMKAEISRQLSNDLPYITNQLNATMQAEQAETRRLISNIVNNNTSSSQNIQYDGSNNFNIQNLILQNHDDVAQLFNEAESVRLRTKPF